MNISDSRMQDLLTVSRYEKKHKVYVERGGELLKYRSS